MKKSDMRRVGKKRVAENSDVKEGEVGEMALVKMREGSDVDELYEGALEEGLMGEEIARELANESERAVSVAILGNVDREVVKAEERGERVSVRLSAEIIGRLKASLSCGANEKEACHFAGISEKTLGLMKEKFPLLGRYVEAWKSRIILKAKGVISDALAAGDVSVAKWVLERRSRKEWGNFGINVAQLLEAKRGGIGGRGGAVNINISMEKIRDLSRKVPLNFSGKGGKYEVIDVDEVRNGK